MIRQFIVVALAVIGQVMRSEAQGNRPASSHIVLRGESSGGMLTLMPVPGGNSPYICITNKLGESANSTIRRLAAQLMESAECLKQTAGHPVLAETENSLELLGGGLADPSWIFGGTETGFSIPPPPDSLSISYDSNHVGLEWVNPPGDCYDSISLVCGGIPIIKLDGKTTHFSYERSGFGGAYAFSNNCTFMILGSKNGAPSNGAGAHLKNRVLQQSLMNIPFAQGVAPSFRIWRQNTSEGALKFTQGTLPGMAPNADVRQFQGKGFFQIISGNKTFSGGVSRRFLGLMAGHNYRVRARMNTFETKGGDWGFTLNASPNAATRADLTAAQMAGVAELPDHSSGSTIGLIARLDSTNATEGKWIEFASGPNKDGKSTTDVFLPADGGNSITIWFRFEGKDMLDCAVGLDSVSIEDLGEKK